VRSQAVRVADEVEARLAASAWDPPPPTSAAGEVATFALRLSGTRRQARRRGGLRRLIVQFALAACVALAAGCDKPDASPAATQTAISQLQRVGGSAASIGQQPRASPARFTDLVLVDPGSQTQPWAILVPKDGNTPVLVDRNGAGLDTPGATYDLAAQPIGVGTRDGPSQFLDPLTPADRTASGTTPAVGASPGNQAVSSWSQDERFLAPVRAIAGQPTVLDAAYNAEAAVAAGGTHTYLNGVVLRVDPDNPVIEVIDRALLESGRPTRAEDVVHVAIRPGERSLYDPGLVVNLRDVAVDRQQTDVDGQPTTVYVANAALDGARVEPNGRVDLQGLLQPRLQQVDQDLALQSQDTGASPTAGAGTPQPTAAPPTAQATVQATAAPGGTTPIQPVIVNRSSGGGGPSFVDDFLIWMWLTHSGWYGGPSVIINNPSPASYRPSGGTYYYAPPPAPSSSTPSSPAAEQAAARSTALQASRSAVSAQASGTGGGVAATNKAAADASAHVSAATSKAASVAGQVSSSSVGRSASSAAPSSGSSTASRSAGSVSAGTRGSAGSSSSSSSSSASSSSSRGFGSSSSSGGKGISGGSTSSSS